MAAGAEESLRLCQQSSPNLLVSMRTAADLANDGIVFDGRPSVPPCMILDTQSLVAVAANVFSGGESRDESLRCRQRGSPNLLVLMHTAADLANDGIVLGGRPAVPRV